MDEVNEIAMELARKFKEAINYESKFRLVDRLNIADFYLEESSKIDKAAKNLNVYADFIKCLKILGVYHD